MTHDIEEYFTRKYVALKMQVSLMTVDKWIKKGVLKAIKFERIVRIKKSSFDALAQIIKS